MAVSSNLKKDGLKSFKNLNKGFCKNVSRRNKKKDQLFSIEFGSKLRYRFRTNKNQEFWSKNTVANEVWFIRLLIDFNLLTDGGGFLRFKCEFEWTKCPRINISCWVTYEVQVSFITAKSCLRCTSSTLWNHQSMVCSKKAQSNMSNCPTDWIHCHHASQYLRIHL